MPTFAKFAGLHTSHNYIGSTPDGAMSQADNCLINSQDTIEPRRGQYTLSYNFSSGEYANALFAYGSTLIANYGSKLCRDTGAAFSDYSGTFTPVDDALCRMRGIEAAQNFYVNTATGVKVLDSSEGSFSAAGVPQCLDLYEVGGTRSASGFLGNDKAVAYRAVIGQKDANGRWHYGAPSQRTVVANVSTDIAIGNLGRLTNVVTANLTSGDFSTKYLVVGQTIEMTSAGEANFVNGTKTISAVDVENNSFSYNEVGANAASSAVQTFLIGNRSSKIAVGIPDGTSSTDAVQLFRTTVAGSATTDPGDETYQVYETNPPAARTVAAGGISKATTGVVTVTSNGHPYVVGQTVELYPGEGVVTNLYPGPKIVTSITTNTFTYSDSTFPSATYVNGGSQTFTARTVVIHDTTPETLLGDPLYTNPNTGDGIEASSYEPPIGKDMNRGGGRLWWLNTTKKHFFDLQMLGTPSTSGSDTITFTVDGVAFVYTATATFINTIVPTRPGDRGYFVYANGSTAANIENTALDLVRCINDSASATPFYAVYLSSVDDVPGKIRIIEKSVGGSPIYVTAANATIWNPVLPSSGTTVYSDNEANPGGVVWSDTYDIESVPAGNELTVGDRNDPIYRGIWLRDSQFIFKKQGGVYVLPNQLPFRSRELDPTIRLRAPDTVVTLNNQIYALADQGLVTVTESGVSIIGWPLDYDFRSLLNTAGTSVLRTAFAVAYESERQLWLWLPERSTDTYAKQAYIYNHATRTFTRAPVYRRCGVVMPGTDILWMGSATTNSLMRERKSFDVTDYVDETYSVTLSAASSTTLTLDSTAHVAVGDLLTDSSGHVAYVTAVNSTTSITTSETQSWTVPSTLTVHSGYTAQLASVPLAVGDPGAGKSVPGASYSFRSLQARYAKSTIATDEEPTLAEYAIDGGSGYGSGAYGALPYGNGTDNVNRYVAFGATGSLVQLGFKCRQARASWRLLAVNAGMQAQSGRGR